MTNQLKKKKYNTKEEDYDDININNSEENSIDNENAEILKKYERKLKIYTNINSKKLAKKISNEKESANRLRLLRESLGLTLQKMAILCDLPLGKFTRLEGGGTPHGTPISPQDITRICVAVLKNFGILIQTEWLSCQTSEMPAALLSTNEIRKKVEEYLNNIIDNKMIQDTLSIFTEIYCLERVHGIDNTTFTMISDNRLSNKYKKGDYVGGIIIPKDKYHLVSGYDCIITFNKDPDVKFVRTIHYPLNTQNDTLYNDEILLLLTETKEPVVIQKEEVNNIWLIFYHRKNYEEFTHLLSKIYEKETKVNEKETKVNKN
jgi:hypothetical protein